ncbi:cyclin-like protein [Auriculariales sp. MPI-PUGE-AT-0066]|nr:cyclin-like protein [Auriculariales sp. MPI-PUGE-AT-0066]
MEPQADIRVRNYHAYYTPAQITKRSESTRGKLTESQEERMRQQACTFVDAVGCRMGFPRKTIATAQILYHKFYLHFPRKDFVYTDVTMAALYVATKIQDTHKKPREILMASYAIRFPELAAKVKAIGGDIEIAADTVEADRQRLLAVERLILECICFKFTLRTPFSYVVKFGRVLQASRELTGLAWRIAVDSNRTLAPLMYPPHTIALASIRMAALLSSSASSSPSPEPASGTIASLLSTSGPWEAEYKVALVDLEDICHILVDLFLIHSGPISSTTFSSPALATPADSPPQQAVWQAPTAADKLTKLKIAMRETDHDPRNHYDISDGAADEDDASTRQEGTTRYFFKPGTD